MKHALRAVIAVTLGAGLAAAAQAQGTVNQAQGTLNQQSGLSGSSMQSAAPASNMQSAAPATNIQATAPAMRTQRAATKIRHPSTRPEIRQVQLRLKSEGLYRGRITGVMDQQTRIALTRFEKQNGVPRTASLTRVSRLMAHHQTAGSGSSMQRTHIARVSKTPKAQTTGVGSSTPTKQSIGATPITPPATGMPPAGAGGSTSIGKPTTGQTTTTVPPATGTTTNR
jgi:hypothetical protein